MSKKCPRCVLVIVRQRLRISATFSHEETNMLLRVRFQTDRFVCNFTDFVTRFPGLLADLYKRAECKGPPRARLGPTVAVVPASVRSALVRLTEEALFARKTYHLEPSYVRDDTETLLSLRYSKMDGNITSLTTSRLVFKTSLFARALTSF